MADSYVNLNEQEILDHEVWSDIDPDSNIINNLFPNYESASQSLYYTINDYNSKFGMNNHYFSVFHQNVRSINNKLDIVTSFFDSLCNFPDILILTETWLNDATKDNFNIRGCVSYHSVRPLRTGGGYPYLWVLIIHQNILMNYPFVMLLLRSLLFGSFMVMEAYILLQSIDLTLILFKIHSFLVTFIKS